MAKLLTDMDEDTTIASLDGVGAYDHVSRACFLEELSSNPELEPILPFVRLWYSRPSTYTIAATALCSHHHRFHNDVGLGSKPRLSRRATVTPR